MSPGSPLGQLEHLVLLAILQCRNEGGAVDIRRRLRRDAERQVARSTVYTTLQRLEEKGFVVWETEDGPPARGGIPRRTYGVSEEGLAALREYRKAIDRLSEGLDEELEWVT